MIVKTIHSMRWGNSEKTSVGLFADTDKGTNLQIGTPYDATSIIWDTIKDFPVSQIAAYVAPPVVE